MKQINNEQMSQLLESGYELRNIEYKPSFEWGDKDSAWVQLRVIRAILAMSNTRYGGQIVVGIAVNDDRSISLPGMSDEHLQSFYDFDRVKGVIDGFSFTNIDLDISWGEFQGGKFVTFTVQEFEEIPSICRKNSDIEDILTVHDIYVRSRKAPYGSIKATDAELREIIHMAVDKEKSDLKSRGWTKESIVSAEEYYKKQVKDII